MAEQLAPTPIQPPATTIMAGHNKWSKIKRTKEVVDAKRGKLFSKMAKEITIAVRDGGGDIDLNPRLRNAVAAARKQSMPGDNIDRAIKKGSGELVGEAIEEIIYEGYGPSGIAFIIEVATDNKNRSAADIRSLFSKNNGNLGTSGSVAYMFNRKGEIRIPSELITEDRLLELALEAGAEDSFHEDEEHVILTDPSDLFQVSCHLQNANIETTSQQLVYIPQNNITISDKETAQSILRLYEALDDYDDTQNVFANFDLPDSLMDSL